MLLEDRRRPFDASSALAAGAMLCFAALAAWRWSSSGLLFFLLLALRDFIAAFLLMIRRPNESPRSCRIERVTALVSSGIPLLYLHGSADSPWYQSGLAELLVIGGYTLSTIALLELGKSFGISPADRGQIYSGIYRTVRHPMYLGYAIAEFGLVLTNPANLIFFVPSILLYRLRSRWEVSARVELPR